MVNCFFNRACAHPSDNHTLGIWCANIIEEVIFASCELRELIHRVLHDCWARHVIGIRRLACLEENVGILRGTAYHRLVGTARAPDAPRLLVQHAPDLSSETAAALLISCEVRNPSKKWRNGTRDSRVAKCARSTPSPRLPARNSTKAWHIPSSGRPSRPNGRQKWKERASPGSRRNVDDIGCQFTGNLVHIGNHQQQSLGGCKGGAESTRLQRTMQCACGAAFALHLGHQWARAPNILRRSSFHWSAHSPMGEDGVIGYIVITSAQPICYGSRGFIAVENHRFLVLSFSSLLPITYFASLYCCCSDMKGPSKSSVKSLLIARNALNLVRRVFGGYDKRSLFPCRCAAAGGCRFCS